MTQFRVFLGAPSRGAITQESTDTSPPRWKTISSTSSQSFSAVFPPSTLEAASRRISLIYQNIIFDDVEEESLSCDREDEEETNLISWPPTDPRGASSRHIHGPIVSFLDTTSVSHGQLLFSETQETTSYNYSDASSIARFPAFHFSLHALSSLSSLSANKPPHKVSILGVALEIEGPDTIRIKNGVDAGKDVSILKIILGDADGQVCKLTAWREVADAWGGAGELPAAKRGDVVFIENIKASYEPSTAATLTASPFLKSKLEICYRTMPYTHEDKSLRPDLRLGASDAAVKKVAALVDWFEEIAGLVA